MAAVTAAEFAVNVAEVAPAAIGILTTGSVTAVVPAGKDSVTVTPPAGAGEFSTTVPVEACPPTTLGGLKKIWLTAAAAGVTVSVAFSITLPRVAVIVATCWLVTTSVVTANVAVVLPEGIATLGGT